MANNGIGIVGIAGGCTIMPLKVADRRGSMSFVSITNAIYYAADNGADVISMSLGAAITSGFAVVYLYGDKAPFSWFFQYLPFENIGYPVPISHWVKLLGNASAIALVLGGVLLFVNRLNISDKLVGNTTAFDRFFLWVVLGVIGTGVFTEIFRFMAIDPIVGFSVYILHLGLVLCLFLTLPYSKFAHILYRTLAMTHERMTSGK